MTQSTQSAVLFELEKPLRLVRLTLPPLKPGQVRVKIKYTCVCHTQLLEVRGKRGPDRFLPHTLGHEASGVVTEVGSDVRKVKVGDSVVLSWIKGSGADIPSTVYESAEGKVNSGAISTFMEETITCENRVTPIPKEMPLREAALLGCAVPTGSGIVRNTAKVKPGSSIAVFGIGGIGMSILLAASISEPVMLIAVDVSEKKLEQAKRLGATHTVNAKSENPVAKILELTETSGVDYAFEAAGKRQTMEQAFEVTSARKGGLCVLAGNLPQGEKVSIDPFELIKGKKIVGTWGGETDADRDIPDYAQLFLSGKLNLSELLTHEYSLPDINKALDALEKGEVGRAVINLNAH